MNDKPKPTIEELEAILAVANDDGMVTINPDGTVTVTPGTKPISTRELAEVRRGEPQY